MTITSPPHVELDAPARVAYLLPVPKAAKLEDLPFEEAMQKLESTVEAMESGDLPLEQLLVRFEEGTQLARHCQGRLAAADLKIQQLEKNVAGDLVLQTIAGEQPGTPDIDS